MTRRGALIAAIAVGLALLIATAAFDVVNYVGLQDNQTVQATSQKASTKTRISTVSQRCDLTHQLMAAFADRPQVAAGFAVSYAKCEKQLATVKRINASTPNP